MYAAERRSMKSVPKVNHRLVARLDAEHREQVVFVLGGRPTQDTEFRRRMWFIVQLRKLGYFKKRSRRAPPRST